MLLANVTITAPRLRKIVVYDIKIGYIQICTCNGHKQQHIMTQNNLPHKTIQQQKKPAVILASTIYKPPVEHAWLPFP